MIAHQTSTLVTAGALLMLGVESGWAQQRIEEAGRDIVVRDNQASELVKGHTVIVVSERGITIVDDPAHPLHMTAVDCRGIVEEFSDGKYKGNGYCTNTDREGHKLVSRWSASSDMGGGRYEVAAGTGKFEGAKGEGTATVTEISSGPQGRQVAQWRGWAEYPNRSK